MPAMAPAQSDPRAADRPTRGTLLPPEVSARLRRRLVDLAGLLGLALVGALGLAILSYHPADPSWNTATGESAGAIGNWLGQPGAYVGDLARQALGGAAWLLVALGAGWALTILRHRPLGRWSLRVPVGALAILLTAAALAALAPTAGGGAGVVLLAAAEGGLEGLAGWSHRGVLAVMAGALGLAGLMVALGLSPGDLMAAARRLGRAPRWAESRPGTLRRASRAVSVLATGVVGALRRGTPAPESPVDLRRAPPPEATPERDTGLGIPPLTLKPVERTAVPPEEPRKPRLAPVVTAKATGAPARSAGEDRQARLNLEGPGPEGTFELPPVDVLQRAAPNPTAHLDEEALQRNAAMLEGVLEDFGVRGEIVKVSPGPVVTLYELEPAPGTKSARVIGLADDIARSMSALAVRVAVVPGRNVIGIELPNARRETVWLRELLEAEAYGKAQAKLALILGKDIGGGPVIADLARMPHLLVAGTTGSGKSVAINTMILSLLYRLPPDRCRFIMVDPKMLELSIYEGIPHLLAPVVTDPKKAVVALKWAVREMEDRYRSMSKLGVRNIDGFNARLRQARAEGEVLTRKVQTGFDPDTGKPLVEEQPMDMTELPYIVVIVDEMADLMLVAGKDIEAAIQRLAQMARAAGIHLIMATQRPSVDVITGTIKANFPTRISFQVTSKIDSRTILGEQGAEQLLGQGDMLYMAGGGRITRVHGPFVRDEEVERVVAFLKTQGEPDYVDAVTEDEEEFDPFDETDGSPGAAAAAAESGDMLYDQAVAVVCRERKASTSFIQRHLRIGYNSAARLIERMEREGVVSRPNHVGKREVLAGEV